MTLPVLRVFEASGKPDRFSGFGETAAKHGVDGCASRELLNRIRGKRVHIVENLIEPIGSEDFELGRL